SARFLPHCSAIDLPVISISTSYCAGVRLENMWATCTCLHSKCGLSNGDTDLIDLVKGPRVASHVGDPTWRMRSLYVIVFCALICPAFACACNISRMRTTTPVAFGPVVKTFLSPTSRKRCSDHARAYASSVCPPSVQ